ncbi:MAG: nucleotidyltransferase family protein [Gammaproteobacteria bacterium]|nr:nucleotidyltransferase family protein [Gammaproteobacteria bacterium]
MKAMILAAGRGVRLRPLTDSIPKPLIRIHGKPLIQYHVEALAAAGITDLVINVSHMAGRIKGYLEDGHRFGVNIQYSFEKQPLEMAGGIIQALPLLGKDPFIVISADIWTDFDYAKLPNRPSKLAHVVLANNPDENPDGDFGLDKNYLTEGDTARYTFGGIGVYAPELFDGLEQGVMTIGPILREAIPKKLVTGEHFTGRWHNVGSLQQVKALNATYA